MPNKTTNYIKRLSLLLMLLHLIVNSVYSQEKNWITQKFDSTISVDMLGDVFEFDTVFDGIKTHQLYSEFESSSFFVQKFLFTKDNADNDFSKLPYNDKSLDDTYQEVIKGFEATVPFKIITKEQIKKDTYKGYRVLFVDSLEKPIFEFHLFILNKYLYTFMYSNTDRFDEIEKNKFFNSINIGSDQEVNQYLGKSKEYKIGVIVGKLVFFFSILIAIIIAVIVRMKNKKAIRNIAKIYEKEKLKDIE
jgi:hypothetical protein